jgi:hypothetical protein
VYARIATQPSPVLVLKPCKYNGLRSRQVRAVKSKNWTYLHGNKVDSLIDIKQLDNTNQE